MRNAVTSYGSQGKTVDHILFADSMIDTATNASCPAMVCNDFPWTEERSDLHHG
jgi:hypothetical protein